MNSNSRTSEPEKRRVETTHGGKNVEEVEAPSPISDTDYSGHLHNFVQDTSEKDFTAFMCKDDKCGAVVLYDKIDS